MILDEILNGYGTSTYGETALAYADEVLLNPEKQEDSKPVKETSFSAIRIKANWSELLEGYPYYMEGTDLEDNSVTEVFSSIRGDDYKRSTFDNACATRVSLGLPNTDIEVPKHFLISTGKFKGKGFIASAVKLKNWLIKSSVFGEPDFKFIHSIENRDTTLGEVQTKINGRNGIYLAIGGNIGASGHATLWIGEKNDAIGGNNYIDSGADIYFWEVK